MSKQFTISIWVGLMASQQIYGRFLPSEEATQFVQCMGWGEKVLQLAQQYHNSGNLRFAATLINKLIISESHHQDDAKLQLAEVYQKLGYGAENGTWRYIYLVGAYELQNGPQPAVGTLDLDELFDTIAIFASAVAGKPLKLAKLFTVGQVENWYAITTFVQVPNHAFDIVSP
ncbi:hypothetical protein MKX08_004807 [Trichoderma sp. CBMAI-0020]|nr:hypothetical protein MKX08_004807 [Trichoderma sp. CBMAI-0020]